MENNKEKIVSYKDLIMWCKAKDLAVCIYKITEKFPREEIYGLTNQLRRAAVSIASNIAEGFRRKFPKEKCQFLRMAYGSAAEIDTQLIIAKELGYLNEGEYVKIIMSLEEIMKMINVVLLKLYP